MEENKFLNINITNVEIITLSMFSLITPMLLGHYQLLTGSIINFLLFRSAIKYGFKRTLPIIILPSVGVFISGIIFGNLTKYLLFFIPFIWIANSIYILKKQVILSSLLKSSFLFVVALIAVYIFNFPKTFLLAMGLIQLVTALIGAILAKEIIKKNLFNFLNF